jgi:hypothetical protein
MQSPFARPGEETFSFSANACGWSDCSESYAAAYASMYAFARVLLHLSGGVEDFADVLERQKAQ